MINKQKQKRKQTVLRVKPDENFVVTPYVENICQRGLAYLKAGYSVHLSGPAGTGKTTLALHLAGLLGRPMILIYGDEEFGSSDLLGGSKGVTTKKLRDNFIHSVLKTEETTKSIWIDERVMIACKNGYTMIYDEFSRSRAEANNVLLPILEERVLALSSQSNDGNYIPVHPDFRAIFTSNPDEFAGVYTPASALLDRMVTIRVSYYDRETEINITKAKSGFSTEEASKIVDIVRTVREEVNTINPPTVRACIMIGEILNQRQGKLSLDDQILIETCLDVFGLPKDNDEQVLEIIEDVLTSKLRVVKEEQNEIGVQEDEIT